MQTTSFGMISNTGIWRINSTPGNRRTNRKRTLILGFHTSITIPTLERVVPEGVSKVEIVTAQTSWAHTAHDCNLSLQRSLKIQAQCTRLNKSEQI